MPLAAAGIIGLGLLPILGGPQQPLHWAVTAGTVGFGVLLWLRRRVRGPEGALPGVPRQAARQAARALWIVCAVVAALVAIIVVARVQSGGSIAALSLALPAAGLGWLVVLALQTWFYREPVADSAPGNERPSRRPPNWDALSSSRSSTPPPDRHVSA